MLFNSYEFIFLFLPVTLVVYYYLNRIKLPVAAKVWLAFASLFFYAWWNPAYLVLISLSIGFNYASGTIIDHLNHKLPRRENLRTISLSLGIGGNLALLGYYKYMNFFITNLNHLMNYHFAILQVALPLGISFFTFTQIAYLVDIYREKAQEYELLNYILFVTFFPHLIAGPIIHHKEMMPQFASLKSKLLNYKHFSQGLLLFSIGLFKKVIIADSFAVWANHGFTAQGPLTSLEAWATSLSFTFQIYFDFSGYTDMALGLALMFNIKLPINFNSPYKALNIQDFWRRWHITLSRFLSEYIYIPLGGNRRSDYNTYANLMATFLIGGVWHGAGWTFLLWGCLHGGAMLVHRAWRLSNRTMPKILAWFLTFIFINITWVFFRAANWQEAGKVLKGMFFLNGTILPAAWKTKTPLHSWPGIKYGNPLENIHGDEVTIFLIALSLFGCLYLRNSNEIIYNFKPKWYYAFFTTILFFIAILNIDKTTIFLYFNF